LQEIINQKRGKSLETINNQKQIQLYRIFFLFHRSAFCIFGVVYAVRLVNQFGFNNQQVVSLEMIFCIASLLFEVPTGIVADKLGHKESIVLGSFCWLASTIICIIGSTYEVLVISEIFAALAFAFISGALDAWLGALFSQEFEFNEFKRKCNHECRILMLILSVSSGYLMQYFGYAIPYYIAIAMFLVAFILSLFLKKEKKHSQKESVIIADSIKYYLSKPKLLSLAFLGMTNTLWLTPIFMLWGPLFTKDLGYPESWLGIIAALMTIGSVVGGYLELKFQKKLTKNSLLTEIIFQVSIGLSVIILSLNLNHNIVIIIGIFFIFEILTHANIQFSTIYANSYWRGRKDEATVASIHSLIIRIGGTIGSIFVGSIADIYGRPQTWTISGTMMIVTTIIILFFTTKSKNKIIV
jgi:MFS family permease